MLSENHGANLPRTLVGDWAKKPQRCRQWTAHMQQVRRVCFSCSTLLRFPIPGGFADAFTASPPSSPASTDFAGAFLRGPASVAEKAKLALFVNSAHALSIYIYTQYTLYIYTCIH